MKVASRMFIGASCVHRDAPDRSWIKKKEEEEKMEKDFFHHTKILKWTLRRRRGGKKSTQNPFPPIFYDMALPKSC